MIYGDVMPVPNLPNRAVLGMHLSLPDGRIFEGQELPDGTGCCAWVYVGDLLTPLEVKVMAIEAEWPPDWMKGRYGPLKTGLVRVSRKLLRDLGLDPESFV